MQDIKKTNRRHGHYQRPLVVPNRSEPPKKEVKKSKGVPFNPNGFMDGYVGAPKPAQQPKQYTAQKSPSLAVKHATPKPAIHKPAQHVAAKPATAKEPVAKIPTKTEAPQQVLHRTVLPSREPHKPKETKRWRRTFATSLLCVIVAASGYVLVDAWLTNQQIAKQTHSVAGASNNQDQEGRDESNVSDESIEKYSVAADLPRVISISKLSSKGRVLQMGVKSDNQLKAPANIFDTGWYTGSAKPGQSGAVLIDGHVSGPTRPGVFKNLKNLTHGDTINLDNGARTNFKYEVKKVATVPVDQVDMGSMLRPFDGSKQGLNLITCGGRFNAKTQQYESRTLVYATLVE